MTEMGKKVAAAMLAVQRYPWEQGVCAQALYEAGADNVWMAMAHDAVLRQTEDGRLAVTGANIAVTDPAANGEVVLRAYQRTGNPLFAQGAQRMMDYLMKSAPRTDDGVIYHNTISFHDGYSPAQLWVDACYMAPPFIAAMGEIGEAARQMRGYFAYLKDANTGLLYHIYDVGTQSFVRKVLWATGNGWALMGAARVLELAKARGRDDVAVQMRELGVSLLISMLPYQGEDGRFHDILDDETSFIDGSSAMMMSVFIYRGVANGWLDKKFLPMAEKVYSTMCEKVDTMGIIREVCGCPHFVSEGTSAEAQAAFVMMDAWREKILAKA